MTKRYVIAGFPGVDLGWIRLGGPGLGNLLFIWARALVRARQTGAELVSPVWHQIKFGPWLRGEADKRSYVDVFPLRSFAAVWTDVVRCRLLGRKVDQFTSCPMQVGGVEYEIVTDGRPCFHDLEPYREAICAALIKTVRRSAIPKEGESPGIAVHVRLGDFARPTPHSATVETNTSLPIGWYVEAITYCRKWLANSDDIVTVFSDGTDRELAPLLALPRVQRLKTPTNALRDMMLMSRADILIMSYSTFSLWSAFIGQPTVITPVDLHARGFFTQHFVRQHVFSLSSAWKRLTTDVP